MEKNDFKEAESPQHFKTNSVIDREIMYLIFNCK